jgi:aromatic-L-amino-acid decarboxylase
MTVITKSLISSEETLDPSDWEEMRSLAKRMVNDMFDYLETLRERPVWQPIPNEVKESFRAPLPLAGEPADTVYEEFRKNILPYPLGNIHPRSWGWVQGNGTPLGMMADMLAAGMNSNLAGADHAANYVESQVIDWCKEMLGYPKDASGLLVSGASVANLIGLAVARNAEVDVDVRRYGLQETNRHLTIYGSVEMHSSVGRAVEVLGLGNKFLRRIRVDEAYRIDVGALQEAIESDLKEGLRPICIIGNAVSTNTGAIDPLHELAKIAAKYGLWFHVDGASGALAYLSPELRPLLVGMERADSLAFDLHKWGYLQFEAGCVLIRDSKAHRRTFAPREDYLKHADRGAAGGDIWYSELGVQFTRSFRALKVWMALKTYGVDKLGRIIRQNVEQASYLAELINQSPNLELMAPVALHVVCFRFTAPELTNTQLNAVNEELLIRLQESGVALPSGTRIRDRFSIRCAITNYRSRREDFEALVYHVVRIGKTLLAQGWAEKSE